MKFGEVLTNEQLNRAWDDEAERVAVADMGCRCCAHNTAERVQLQVALELRTRELEQARAELRRLRDEMEGVEDERCGRLIT